MGYLYLFSPERIALVCERYPFAFHRCKYYLPITLPITLRGRPCDVRLWPRLEPGPVVRHDLRMGSPHPRAGRFRAALDIEASGDLALRLGTARLPVGDGGWERGVPGDWLAGLIEDWRAFDPLSLQARLDRLTHLRAEVGGVSVHLVHAPGNGPEPLPLVLTHRWPSSL